MWQCQSFMDAILPWLNPRMNLLTNDADIFILLAEALTDNYWVCVLCFLIRVA